MTEYQRKWLLDLQSKGVKFEYCNINDEWVNDGKCTFSASQEKYRIQAQPIPNIPDWREVCWGMQDKGVKFKMLWGSMWNEGIYDFEKERDRYQLIEQPIPEWKEEMTKETKLDPREEIPHRELQIQWHEDSLHHLRTGEPMKKWQCKPDGDNRWFDYTGLPTWDRDCEYRRKPRTVTYWHCLVRYVTGAIEFEVISGVDKQEMLGVVEEYKQYVEKNNKQIKFGPIIETAVEVED